MTALLAACRKTHHECLEMFYNENKFRLPPLGEGYSLLFKKHPAFSLIQHVEVDIINLRIWNSTDTTNPIEVIEVGKVRQMVDTTVSVCVQDLVNLCPSLKTLNAPTPDVENLAAWQGMIIAFLQ